MESQDNVTPPPPPPITLVPAKSGLKLDDPENHAEACAEPRTGAVGTQYLSTST